MLRLHCKFYSHVNYSVTKISSTSSMSPNTFYSHVNYSVTKIRFGHSSKRRKFYSHVNYSVTKMPNTQAYSEIGFTVT